MTSIDENKTQPPATTANKRPNEQGLVHIDAFVKITDPNTNEILIEIRE
jgi:hypothetical protein